MFTNITCVFRCGGMEVSTSKLRIRVKILSIPSNRNTIFERSCYGPALGSHSKVATKSFTNNLSFITVVQ